jgi:hypothetical protein
MAEHGETLPQQTQRLLDTIGGRAAGQPGPKWTSSLAEQVRQAPLWRGTGEQWLNTLRNRSGVRAEELEYTGLRNFLSANAGRTLSRQEVARALKPVEVGEVIRSGGGKLKTMDELEQLHPEEFRILRDAGLEPDLGPDGADFGFIGRSDSSYGDNVYTPEDFAPETPEYDAAHTLERAFYRRAFYGVFDDMGQFQQYTLPGGENYREVLLTLPPKRASSQELSRGGLVKVADEDQIFRGSHFDEPNVLAHLRTKDRVVPPDRNQIKDISRRVSIAVAALPEHLASGSVDVAIRKRAITPEEAGLLSKARGWRNKYAEMSGAAGEQVLFIEEIQSDWHQQGRERGYRQSVTSVESSVNENRVPDAPFKKTWPELALKRALRMAAEEGKDRIAWTTGRQQAERYNLGQFVDQIRWYKKSENSYELDLVKDGRIGNRLEVLEDQLVDYVGKELAEQITGSSDKTGQVEGRDLQVGGHGMTAFYDKMLVNLANKLGKKYGARVETVKLPTGRNTDGNFVGTRAMEGGKPELLEVHSLKLTPELKKKALGGWPLFAGAPLGALADSDEDDDDDEEAE